MRLESLLPLIEGTLLNTPSINAFEGITDKASKVSRGDLYISIDGDTDQIEQALAKGAYGIVFDTSLTPLDQESAWIHVASSFDAHLKLLRFHLLPKQLEVFYTDIATLEYLQMLKSDKSIKIISADLGDIVTKLWDLDGANKLIIKNQPEVKLLFPTAKQLQAEDDAIKLSPVSLFESELFIQSDYLGRFKVPFALADAFSLALAFLKVHHYEYTLDHIAFIASEDVQFYDNVFLPKDFGKGSKAVIYLQDPSKIERWVAMLNTLTPWIKYRLFLNKEQNRARYNEATFFEDEQNLLQHFMQTSFNYALVCGASKHLLVSSHHPMQATLF